MFRKLALTIIPGVALFTVAALALASLAPRTHATQTVQVAARSGYIVASS